MSLPSIKKNYAINALLTVVNLAFPFATLAYLARIIGPGYLGRYYVAGSLTAYFLFAASCGIPMYGTRELGRLRADREGLARVFSELALLNVASSLAAGAAFLAVALAVPAFRADWRLFLLLGAMVPLNALSIDFLFLGLENQANIAVRALISKAVSLACLFLFVRDAGDLLHYAAITTGGLLLHNALALPAALRLGAFRLGGLKPWRHARPLAWLALTLLASNVYLNLDSVVLGLMTDPAQVGYYNAAMRLVRTTVTLATAAAVTVIPRLTYHLNAGSEAAYRELLAKGLGLAYLAAIPATIMLAAVAPALIDLVFGHAFAPAVPVLEIAAPLVAINSATNFLALQVLFPKGDEKLVFYGSLAAASVSLGLIVALAPVLGPRGAGLAAVSAEAAALALQYGWSVRRHGQGLYAGIGAWRYLAAGAAMAIPLLAYRASGRVGILSLGSVLIGSAALYLGLLYALGEGHVRALAAAAGARFRR